MGRWKAIVLGVVKWKALLLGAIAFLLSHVVIAAKWTLWFSGDPLYAPWFLNAGVLAIAFTAGTLFVASLAGSMRWAGRDDSLVYSVNIAAGAAPMMAVVIFMLKGGPGTLFPIALAVGACLALVAAFAGGLVVWPLKHTSRRR